MSEIKTGDTVCCSYRGNLRGIVLSVYDPKAWAQTLRFPHHNPSAEEVTAHVNHLIETDRLIQDRIPVLWSFGKAYFESIHSLQVVK